MEDAIRKTEILIEALPYIKKFQEKVIVVKYGGSALTNRKKRLRALEDIVFMSLAGMRPVIVHGGGPYINKKFKKNKLKAQFIDGLRVTGEKEIKVIKEALSNINRRIVKEIRSLGGKAQRVAGRKVIKVRRHRNFKELGYVGEITYVNSGRVESICAREIIPVISPLGLGRDGHIYNINADQASAYIAKSLSAEKLALLTNVEGIYRDEKDASSLISTLTKGRVRTLIKKGIIGSGMIPKVKACMSAIDGGVKKVHIVNGSLPHALLLEIFTDEGIGTEVIK
ncbi:MAG: acetylglutamate kinase [Candidatus Omnitrophica bacterium]|nr:acetylglutamate kinase [Candidatus Omnitrophota bacterium]